MNGDDEDPFSYDLMALSDYDPNQYQPRAPSNVGVGGVLNTPPGPSPSPSILMVVPQFTHLLLREPPD